MKTEPLAPDPNAYFLVAAFAAVGMAVYIDRHTNGGGWVVTIVAMFLIFAAFGILYASAHRKYKTSLELYALWRRSQPALSDPFTIYTIRGTLSMRTTNGEWIDIGEGAGTFHIKGNSEREEWAAINRTLERGAEARRKKQTPPTG